MRTTLTIEEDVALKLKAEMRRTGASLKATVNEVLRVGLNAKRTAKGRARFEVRPCTFGKPAAGLSFDSIADLLEQVEGAAFK